MARYSSNNDGKNVQRGGGGGGGGGCGSNVQELTQYYSDMLLALRLEIEPYLPRIEEHVSEPFLSCHRSEGEADAAAKKAAAAEKNDDPSSVEAARAAEERSRNIQTLTHEMALHILSTVREFLSVGCVDIDDRLIRCAVLYDATPGGLAEFASRGTEEGQLVERLLSDATLMRQMLVGGGAKQNKYGEAMRIYTDIYKRSQHVREAAAAAAAASSHSSSSSWDDFSVDGILHRLALGTALEHAIPIQEFGLTTFVDPVKRYLNYERAYLNGELDPAVQHMTVFECRYITNADAPDDQIIWGREMLRNYRPDLLFSPNYHWRYVQLVRTDVRYKTPEWTGNGVPKSFQQLINGGGKCGPRAWFGRFILRCFGIPTWGVRQRGHAALSHWTPGGWMVCLGAHWRWNWWEDRSGLDFVLDTQAREFRGEYVKVLRAQWIGDALGEAKVHGMKIGTGGLWNALALHLKKAIVDAGGQPPEKRKFSSTRIQTQAERILQTDIGDSDKMITTADDGTITIPAVACSKPQRGTNKILFMKSFLGGMQMHHAPHGGKADETAFEYTFNVSEGGTYILTAFVVTVNMNQQLMVTPNSSRVSIVIDVPYTVGMWEQSAPVELSLVKGRNVLRFHRKTPYCGLTIKHLFLAPLCK